jgi:hypothetical protein
MNFSDLRAILSPVVGSCLANLTAETRPYIPGHSKGTIVKRQSLKVAIFFGPAYGMLTGQPVGPRQWGERLGETPYIMHKGEAYLECFLVSEDRIEWLKEGQSIQVVERQRDEPVKLRCFKLEHIQTLTVFSTV